MTVNTEGLRSEYPVDPSYTIDTFAQKISENGSYEVFVEIVADNLRPVGSLKSDELLIKSDHVDQLWHLKKKMEIKNLIEESEVLLVIGDTLKAIRSSIVGTFSRFYLSVQSKNNRLCFIDFLQSYTC